MAGIADEAQSIVTTAANIAKLRGEDQEARILEGASAKLLQTGSSDYGEVDLFTLILEVPISTYASIDSIEQAEAAVDRLVYQVVRKYPGNRITEVVIAPRDSGKKTALAEEASEEAPEFWTPGYFRLFISHVSAMKQQAHALKKALAEYHIAAFVAHDDIEVTKEWEEEIERALRTMDVLAAIISPGFIQSSWCDQEVGFAMGQGKLIVPLSSEGDPHGFLSKYQAAKIKGQQPPSVAEKLFQILIQNPQSSERMTDALVDRMVNSPSFDASRKTLKLLRQIARLNDSQTAKLVQSIDDNRQVRDAIGVPDGIRALVAAVSKSSK